MSVWSVYYCFHVAFRSTINSTNVPTGQPELPGGTIATQMGTTSTGNGKDYEDKEEETRLGVILCN